MFSCCGNRDDKPAAAAGPQSGPVKAGGSVGVGIVFQPDVTGALHVKSLAIGGPADSSKLVEHGDELHEIDGTNVFRKPVGELAPLILGPPGTTVKLGLKRGDLPNLVNIELKRGWTMDAGGQSRVWSHPLPDNARLSHFSGSK